MPVIKIGRKSIAAIGPVAKPTVFYDETLSGFGLAVRPSGSRSWIVEYRPNGGGRNVAKKRMVLGGAETLAPEEARTAARAILARVTGGADPAAERAEGRRAESFMEIAGAWMAEHVEPRRKVRTTAYYRQVMDTHLLPRLGTMRAAAITRADVERLHREIAKGSKVRAKADAKPRTTREREIGGKTVANRAVTVLAACLAWAIRVGHLPAGTVNAAAGIERFREQGRERFLSGEEMARLGAALREAEGPGIPWQVDETKATKHTPKNGRQVFSPHVVAAVRLLLLTACRRNEILTLRWADVDAERRFLNLADAKAGRRAVPLSEAALAVLQAVPRIGIYVIASDTAGLADEAPRRDLKPIWRAVTRRAGLDGLRLHDLRHTNASVGASGGVSLQIIGSLLGHADVKTSRRYAHLAASPVHAAANAIGAEIAAAIGLPGAEIVDLAARRRA